MNEKRGRALKATGVCLAYGGHRVLDDVAVDVAAGSITSLFGASGAGKSSLLAALAGDGPIDAGSVHVGDKDISVLPLYARAQAGLSYLPQGPNVLWDLTVADNLDVFCDAVGAERTRAAALLKDLGLAGLERHRARELSGGERRRLEVLRALLPPFDCLLCDEPFAALDEVSAETVASAIRAAAQAGASVLLADHKVTVALAVSDRACLLVGGRIEVDVEAADFPTHPTVRHHYRGLER